MNYDEYLGAIIKGSVSEGSTLEIKSLEDPFAGEITKHDRTRIAKTVCAFLNADGGIMILGLEKKEKDGVSSFVGFQKIRDCADLRNRLEVCVRESIRPQDHSTSVHHVRFGEEEVLLIDVRGIRNRSWNAVVA